ncbi:MAG: NADH-quinone oxidoreductase subunit L [Desulfobacterales bacterium]|nr:MAG: NADH-quinone oxidoreductase subunit L [Desulfobacterales bacterium]
MTNTLTSTLVLLPFLAAGCCYVLRSNRVRSLVVLVTGFLLIISAVGLIPLTPFTLSAGNLLGVRVHDLVMVADFLLLFLILYFGFKHRSLVVKILSLLQILLVAYLEFFLIKEVPATGTIYCDSLALIMVLIVSVVGSIICFQAIPYMRNHEAHLRLDKSRQHRFFLVMILFLGAMNGLVLSNDLLFFYFFFEVTTLCSFLLIAHDHTATAIQNAVRALWMNSLGGAAFIVGLTGLYYQSGHLDLQLIIINASPGARVFLLSLALLCLAAFTKSAQFPFQSWLLGAMVAPTPVSALLHSSTMVKVGVYLVLRLAPAIHGTFLSQCVAIFGAFTFLAAAALAVGQSNGKKVLAYSTISNLGLIFACAGLNTPQSVTAGILLIVFHAFIKALLFLCVGTIEQHIASRDIEDMRGVYATMPLTALITVMGVIMMIMPPFGVLLSKWMAMEAAARSFYLILIITLGSALTVMYWARWAGTLMSDPFAGRFKPERQPLLTWGALGALSAGAAVLSLAAPWIYTRMIAPAMSGTYLLPYRASGGILENAAGVFAVLPLSVVAAVGFILSIWAVKRAAGARIVAPYLSGIQVTEPGMFKGPMNRLVKAEAKNYYLSSIFGEHKLTAWVNLGAGVLLILMLGGTL